MPRYLYLLRHAHTAEKHPGQNDLERDLTSTGVKEALIIGRYLYQQQTHFDTILCSTANRTKTTAGLIADALKVDTDKVSPREELYEASPRTFLQFVSELEDDQHHVMCVGHNPAISYLAEFLTGAEVGDMVPAGLAVIRFNLISWREVSQANGSLEHYITPEMVDTFQ
jgi:phosphohistidine phosphatase